MGRFQEAIGHLIDAFIAEHGIEGMKMDGGSDAHALDTQQALTEKTK